MTFRPLPPAGFTPKSALVDRVHLSKRAADDGLVITISRDLAAALGDPHCVALRLGAEADAGHILIAAQIGPTDAAYRLNHKDRRGARKIRVTAHRVGIDAISFPATICPHEITEDGLVVDLRGLRPA